MLARKGSRLITVQGVIFRWVVAPNDGWIDIIAERADDSACRLEVQADYEDKQDGAIGHGAPPLRIITPALMSRIIEAALASVWQPEVKGPPERFRLTLSGCDAPTLIPWAEYERGWTKERQ